MKDYEIVKRTEGDTEIVEVIPKKEEEKTADKKFKKKKL